MTDNFDYDLLNLIVTTATAVGAIWFGIAQTRINKLISRTQDAVELYSSSMIETITDDSGKIISAIPHIHVQNIGTRIIYLDKYIFNGKVYQTHRRVLPSTYSQAQNHYYKIQLPTNEETHVSLEVFYFDQENRHWSSEVIADFNGVNWAVTTLPRKKALVKN